MRSDSLRAWMSAVTEISRSVNAAEPLDQILDDVAEIGCNLVGFDYCGVMLDDAAHQTMEIAGSSGLHTTFLELVRSEGWLEIHPADSSADLPATQAYREGRTITVPDVHAADNKRLQRFAAAQGYRSVLTAPLRVGDENVGILAGYFDQPHVFEAEEIELAELLAEQTATAIQTARLRAEQQNVITELSAVNAELRSRRASFDWADQHHRRLMRLVLNDIGLDGLVSALADMLSASVAVQDSTGRLLGSAAVGVYVDPPKLDPDIVRHDNPDRFEAVRIGDSDREIWLTPVVLSGRLVGRLWVMSDSRPPDVGRQHLIEQFAVVVGLEILKQRHVVEVQGRLSGDLMIDLLRTDEFAQPLAIIQRANALGHDLTTPHWLAVYSAEFKPALDQVARTVRDLSLPQEALVGIYANTLVMLISCDVDPIVVARRVLNQLDEHFADGPATVALTPRIETLADYAANYQVGVRTTQLRRSAGGDGLIDLRRLPLTSLLLLNTTVPEQLRRFAETLIEPLLTYDGRRDTELLVTLRAWLAEGFSTAATAAALTVHVNTVGYRITKIQAILGRDLRSTEVRLELQLAAHVWDILRTGDHTGPSPFTG